MGNDIIKAIEGNRSFTEITQNTRKCIPRAKLKKACEAMKANNSITSIKLVGNKFNKIGGGYISNLLINNKFLTQLVLPWNSFGSEGIIRIAKGLRHNSTVRVLDVSGNGARLEGLTRFCDIMWGEGATPANSTLKVLGFASNDIGDDGLRYLFEHAMVEVLGAGNNGYTAEGIGSALESLKVNRTLSILGLHRSPVHVILDEITQLINSHSTLFEIILDIDISLNNCNNKCSQFNNSLPYQIGLIEVFNEVVEEEEDEQDDTPKALAVEASEMFGTLKVVVVRAQDLYLTSTYPATVVKDPFVQIRCQQQSFRTTSCHSPARSPSWNETFTFYVAAVANPAISEGAHATLFTCSDTITFVLNAKDAAGTDRTSTAQLSLQSLCISQRCDVQLLLSGEVSGSLAVQLLALDFGLPSSESPKIPPELPIVEKGQSVNDSAGRPTTPPTGKRPASPASSTKAVSRRASSVSGQLPVAAIRVTFTERASGKRTSPRPLNSLKKIETICSEFDELCTLFCLHRVTNNKPNMKSHLSLDSFTRPLNERQVETLCALALTEIDNFLR